MNPKPHPRRSLHRRTVRSRVAVLLAFTAVSGLAGADTPSVDAQWRAQSLHFDFMSFTSRYSCTGMEDKVRLILATFGARKDMSVRAYGCPEGPDRPSRMVSVDARFMALAPLGNADAAVAKPADLVKAQWARVGLRPHRPDSLGEGECELVEQMQNLLQKGFVMREAAYHTSCTPHQINVGDYSVSAEVLKPVAP